MYKGAKLKQLRQRLGLSQQEFAIEINVSQAYFSAVESGKKKITKKMLQNISEKWGVEESWFKGGDDSVSDYIMGGIDGGEKGGILKNEYQKRLREKFQIQKDEDWRMLSEKVSEQLSKINFYYQKIIDVQILIQKTLKISKGELLASKEAERMHSVFDDGSFGFLRKEYSTKQELLLFEDQLTQLQSEFESRFFELFQILYRGLRTDIKWTEPLPKSII